MLPVEPAAVDALTGRNTPADQVIPIITVMAKAYTRGNGFDGSWPNPDVAAVITTAAARLAANGSQLARRDKVDDVEQEFRGGFTGWTLAELAVLNRYRKTAM